VASVEQLVLTVECPACRAKVGKPCVGGDAGKEWHRARFQALAPAAGYSQKIPPVIFRVTEEMENQLQADMKRLKITRNEAARRRCFP
jgi:hypothetical protein